MGADPHGQRPPRIACDSLVALRRATADGTVLFAKNSDRPAAECQPLLQQARQRHSPGARLRCTHIEIAQVAETARLIGSRPFWCWGLEHGLNEYGVAIGNQTVFSRDPLPATGLIGMDLVRLGLERGRTAEQAVDVMTALIAAHGQGGSGYGDKEWPYHNSFLVADRQTAFILETSDRQWATRRVGELGSLSNHLTIGTDWEALADGTIEHAIDAGWWSAGCDQRFDFAAAYRDTAVVPDVISSGRHRRTCELLEQHKGSISVGSLKCALRDHYGRPTPFGSLSDLAARSDQRERAIEETPAAGPAGLTPADEQYFSVCMHAEPVGTTTASMIARIPADAGEPLTYWASFGSPCVGAFIPLYVDGEIPAVLSGGGAQPTADSLWWQFKRLLTAVERDWPRYGPPVRQALDHFEAEITEHLRTAHMATRPATDRTAFMQATVDDLQERLRGIASAW
jgi:secernin